jgi:flagellar motility protein MotE (MotC chaperone)
MMPNLRLIPVVLLASMSLLTLKLTGIVMGGGYTLVGLTGAQAQSVPLPPPQTLDVAPTAIAPRPKPASAPQRSWAQEMLGYPDITGSVGGEKKSNETKPPAPVEEAPSGSRGGRRVTLEDHPQMSPAERAVLERLRERRQELEARARELDVREGLLRTAEKRLEARLAEIKQIEGRANAAAEKKDEAETKRLKSLVTMYENMKAKEAARIFDRLEMRVLVEVATQINPRRMSEILAQMSPEAAERLTVELAARGGPGGPRQPSTADLPKIEGRPRS